MDERLIRTNCDEVGDYVVPNVLSPRHLVSRPDNMDETVLLSFFAKRLINVSRLYCIARTARWTFYIAIPTIMLGVLVTNTPTFGKVN